MEKTVLNEYTPVLPDKKGNLKENKEGKLPVLSDIEKVIQQIEARQIDITASYAGWRDIGFALTDSLGEDGRAYYHRISRFYPKYTVFECDKLLDLCPPIATNSTTIK